RGSERRLTESRLSATLRFRRVSSARYTSPMPPLPSRSPITKRPIVFPVRDPDIWLSAVCDRFSVIGGAELDTWENAANRNILCVFVFSRPWRRMLLHGPEAGKCRATKQSLKGRVV